MKGDYCGARNRCACSPLLAQNGFFCESPV